MTGQRSLVAARLARDDKKKNMVVNTKAIKRRLKSVGSTKKITKAMELIAAAKMRKAVNAALDARTYAMLAWNLLVNLSKTQKVQIPLLAVRPVQKILMVIITSNRGLCGSFNSNIIKKTAVQLKTEKAGIDVIGIGKKGADFAKKMGYTLVAAFTNMTDTPNLEDALPIAKMVINAYEKKLYDKVIVAYTDFKSAMLQLAKLMQVLPISEIDFSRNSGIPLVAGEKMNLSDYLFEPNRLDVLQTILPRLVETQIYQTMLESAASEHSARMFAMRSASDAAEDMIKELNLNFNKARQAGITQEIAEIAGGAAALE